ncbi:MAG TPA: hypothetical protein PLN33_20995 [Hyphomonadaceae bacterium]|nr:hypothetical protein [Hyphomonadaceae bacterium]
MYKLENKWNISIEKYGLKNAAGGSGGGRVILLHAENITKSELLPLVFTGRVFSDDIITDRLWRSFGKLLPGETEELQLLKATGSGKNLHANKHIVELFFDSVGLQFQATAMGCKFVGEIPNRKDMFTKTSLEGDSPFADGPEV